MDFNQEEYDMSDNFIEFDIQEALKTTAHAVIATQAVVDLSSCKCWRGDRAVSGKIIASSAGSIKAVIKVIDLSKNVATVYANIPSS